jgi:hypothetical protein
MENYRLSYSCVDLGKDELKALDLLVKINRIRSNNLDEIFIEVQPDWFCEGMDGFFLTDPETGDEEEFSNYETLLTRLDEMLAEVMAE